MTEIILAIVSGVLAGGLSPLLYIRQERKSKNIDNEAKQSEEWKKLYDLEAQKLQVKEAKIDSLYSEIAKHRDEKAEKSAKITELEVEITRLKMLKCEVVACPSRKPPTGY